MLTEAEIAERLPVWTALSDLFLDTELTDRDYAFIARVLGQSAFDAEALQRILIDEVMPAFGTNLINLAGNWTGWPEDIVRDRVVATLSNGPLAWGQRLMINRLWADHIAQEWARIAPLLCDQADP